MSDQRLGDLHGIEHRPLAEAVTRHKEWQVCSTPGSRRMRPTNVVSVPAGRKGVGTGVTSTAGAPASSSAAAELPALPCLASAGQPGSGQFSDGHNSVSLCTRRRWSQRATVGTKWAQKTPDGA